MMKFRHKVMGAGVISALALTGVACENSLSGAEKEAKIREEARVEFRAELEKTFGPLDSLDPTTTTLDLDSAYKAERKVWTRDSEVTGAEMVCIIVLPDADHGADAFDQLESIYGEIDYENGVWLDESSSTAIGYSSYEDSIVWNYPECTGPGQDYFDEQG